jgi:hypothetical protein
MEVEASTAKVGGENLHNPIKSQMVRPRLSVPEFGLPEYGKPNCMAGVSCTDLTIVENDPVAVAIRLNLC